MAAAVGVRFQAHGTLHLLRLRSDQRFEFGDQILYPTEGGPVVGTVAWLGQAAVGDDVPTCLGGASPADLANEAAGRVRRAEIEAGCSPWTSSNPNLASRWRSSTVRRQSVSTSVGC